MPSPLEMDDIIFSIDHLYDCAPMASYVSNIEDYYYEGNTLTIKYVYDATGDYTWNIMLPILTVTGRSK